ncbi:hypothetical protein ONS95_012831 [Cadophora gregata]|uniref:uncharacterized protein n=1 Tax=Cadophora gregata TaxID=51156 RepID=UPI0026DB0CA1|nr:uncharacterized protein ONS95_012831 [Cadophora gregata]KAK0101188.1 hypothetical protein ONS96_006409 [Cadophora gregata f. sp. sojae]KAK0115778.1 hypothetical protein ONS95_012831 [Cadophora gregata]
MPRIPPATLIQAYNTSPLLPIVLRGARTIESATNELRWLREHVKSLRQTCSHVASRKLLRLCERRSRGEPLQYILGSQPFGELDIKCRPGVLIPRPETESYTTYLAKLANDNKLGINFSEKRAIRTLRILDVCSGSGCISLLLHSLLSTNFKLKIFGLDISQQAIALSKQNLAHNVNSGNVNASALIDTPYHPPEVQFGFADIIHHPPRNLGQFDIIISNPPYISRSAFNTQTTRSVRNYEPKQALVPLGQNPDVFYKRLIRMHQVHLSRVLVMEVGDAAQAIRVAALAFEMNNTGFKHAPRVMNRVEIWRDNPDIEAGDGANEVVKELAGEKIRIIGQGKIRAVVLFRERTDRHAIYKERLNSRVVNRLDELGLARASEKEDRSGGGWRRSLGGRRRGRGGCGRRRFLGGSLVRKRDLQMEGKRRKREERRQRNELGEWRRRELREWRARRSNRDRRRIPRSF